MKAWMFENPITHERFTLSDAQMDSINFHVGDWAREHGYELVKTFDISEDNQ